MSAYVVIAIKVLNEDMYAEYVAKVPTIVKKYGGAQDRSRRGDNRSSTGG